MSDQFATFKQFSDPVVAEEIATQLTSGGIPFILDSPPEDLSATFIGTSAYPSIFLRLKPEDFERAHRVLEEYYSKQIGLAERDYYLFSFSDEELTEIISKRDEWGDFDYLLAQKILKERGKNIDSNVLEKLAAERKSSLFQPVPAELSLFILGYLLIAYGVYSSLFPYARVNMLPYIWLTPFISIPIGHFIYRSMKTLPDGDRAFIYRKEDRFRGMIMMYIGTAVFITRLIVYITL